MSTVTATPKTLANAEQKSNVLNASHRCDRCNAQAFIRTVLVSGNDLLWCRHHYLKHEAALAPLIDSIVDETHKLDVNRLIGNENS